MAIDVKDLLQMIFFFNLTYININILFNLQLQNSLRVLKGTYTTLIRVFFFLTKSKYAILSVETEPSFGHKPHIGSPKKYFLGGFNTGTGPDTLNGGKPWQLSCKKKVWGSPSSLSQLTSTNPSFCPDKVGT